MLSELLLAGFIIGVGLCMAGAGTHLYQWLAREQALLRVDGPTLPASLGHLVMSIVCGPYIMLQMGLERGGGENISVGSALVGALVAFGWAFVTGLLFMSAYVAIQF